VNARACRPGQLFQGRFSAVALDEGHLMLAARYVALNPVRARLVQRPQDWAWSSLRAHLAGRDDGLVTVARPCSSGLAISRHASTLRRRRPR
jgi:putative transposase